MEPPISFPPMLPLPGTSRTVFSSELNWPKHSLPAYMGKTFPTISSFWVFVQEINTAYTPVGNTSLVDVIPLEFAEKKCQEILDWADTLDAEMSSETSSTAHVFLFQ
jgi:hypothetical protein